MSLLLYTAALYLLTPLLLLRLWQRSLKAPEYRRRILERFGFFNEPALANTIWVHAVSFGEVNSATPLIRELQSRYPGSSVVVTTTTPTGSARVKELWGDSIFHVYAPYDLPGSLNRFLEKIRPVLLIVLETEIWPNMIVATRKSGAEVMLANARLSEKSARGYARLAPLTTTIFQRISRIVAQSPADAERFVRLGASESRVTVSGSIKFDVEIDSELCEAAVKERLRLRLANRPVWICASTHDGEEAQILAAFRRVLEQLPDTLLIIVPRHPERFDSVAELVVKKGFSLARRSKSETVVARQVLLADTMGELQLLYGCADVATVGGSLVERGGHNSLEAAAWGLPLVNGPSNFNFAEVSALLQRSGALVIVNSGQALADAVIGLLADAEERERKGKAARAVIVQNRGALDRLLAEIQSVMDGRGK